MRAFTLDSFDTPPGLREDLPTPEVGPDQLLVRVQASSVNPVDAFIAVGYLKGYGRARVPGRRWAATTPVSSSRSARPSPATPRATRCTGGCRTPTPPSTRAAGPS